MVQGFSAICCSLAGGKISIPKIFLRKTYDRSCSSFKLILVETQAPQDRKPHMISDSTIIRDGVVQGFCRILEIGTVPSCCRYSMRTPNCFLTYHVEIYYHQSNLFLKESHCKTNMTADFNEVNTPIPPGVEKNCVRKIRWC